MTIFLIVISVLLFLVSAILAGLLYVVVTKFSSYREEIENNNQTFLNNLDVYIQVLNDFVNRDLIYGDTIVFEFVENTKQFRDNILNIFSAKVSEKVETDNVG